MLYSSGIPIFKEAFWMLSLLRRERVEGGRDVGS